MKVVGFLVLLCALAVGFTTSSGSSRPGVFSQKLVILGFDGMDPDLVRRFVAERKLPNIARLIEQGGLYPLETTHSPESPTAWASFATGVNAGKHNIYDFLVRDTATYLPDLGMVRREPAKFLLDWIPIQKPKIISIRGGTSFWVTAGTAGVRSSILTVPVTFPPEDVPKRRAARRAAAPGHPRDDGDVLLLRNGPEPLRRGQHRIRRHPQTAGVQRHGRADRARRTAEPDRAPGAPGDPREGSECH